MIMMDRFGAFYLVALSFSIDYSGNDIQVLRFISNLPMRLCACFVLVESITSIHKKKQEEERCGDRSMRYAERSLLVELFFLKFCHLFGQKRRADA